MSFASYSVIAVDYNGNEYNREERGRSQGDAAKRLLRDHTNFKAVLNGEQGRKNNPYRKLICTQHGIEPNAMDTSLGQAFLEAQSAQSLEAGQLILNALEKKGLRPEIMVDEQTGAEKIVVRPRGMITPEERAEIDENQASIVVLLKKQEQEIALSRKQKQEASINIPAETIPKESQRDIVRKMLPELPDSFIRYDLEQALRRWDYQDLADKTSKLDNLLAWCATQGLITRTGKGQYRCVRPVKTTVAEPIEITETAHEVASPEPPPPQPAPSPAPEPSLGQAPALTSEPVPTEQNPQSAPAVTPSLAGALIDLTLELVTVPVDETTLDAVEREFMQFYERMDSLLKQLRTNARARDRLRTQLAGHSGT
jgi:hypothetical protein